MSLSLNLENRLNFSGFLSSISASVSTVLGFTPADGVTAVANGTDVTFTFSITAPADLRYFEVDNSGSGLYVNDSFVSTDLSSVFDFSDGLNTLTNSASVVRANGIGNVNPVPEGDYNVSVTIDASTIATNPEDVVSVRIELHDTNGDTGDQLPGSPITVTLGTKALPANFISNFNLFSRSGQSLALGSVGGSVTPLVVSTGSITKSRMFDPGGTRPRIDDSRVAVDSEPFFVDRCAAITTLSEVVSSNFGETYNTGVGVQNAATDILHGGIARGAQRIDQLSLGTFYFTDLIVSIGEAKKRIEEAGGTFDWPVHWWAQGEADVVDETSYADYRASLLQYFSDLKTFANAQLDGSYSPKFFTYQISNPFVSGKPDNWGPADALLDVGLNVTDMYCVGPWYWLTYADTAHLTSAYYRIGGELIGKVINKVLNGEDWKPLHWTNVSRVGTTITITYDVPVGPLALDTTLVSDPGDYGFEYSGANITDVSLSGADQVVITIDADSGGTLGYARTQTNNNTVGPTFGARGNLRDSDTTLCYYNASYLYNWACHQEEVVA